VRAAEIIVSHAAKAIEIEDIEARVAELERAAGMGVHRLERPYPRLGALPAGK
jgi:hypothetical protein